MYTYMKRVCDFSLSIIALIICSPIILIVALLIRLGSEGPVLFKQMRPGLKGKPFYIYKFRTMNNQKDEQGNLLPDEARLTTIGKFVRRTSLDELPQLVNVIRGDMSLIGPRPLLMDYLPLYTKEQARRHEVRPGITGWAQVNGRNAISWEQKFELDVWYVDHLSFSLDMRIMWMTFKKVLRREGINQAGHATVSVFKGSEEVRS